MECKFLKIKSVQDIMLEIKLKYDQDPEDWRILRGRDEYGHYDTYVAQGDKELWHMKTEWKNPVLPIGVGRAVKRNLNDEILKLMSTGTNLPIHELYPDSEKLIIALGIGKYSQESTTELTRLLRQNRPSYARKVEPELNLELNRIIHQEQLYKHYI